MGHLSCDKIMVTVTSHRIGKRKDVEDSGEITSYCIGNIC